MLLNFFFRTISYFGDSLKKHCFGNPSSHKLHPVQAGMKVFKYNKKHETYVITQDGARLFHKYIKKPKIELPQKDLILLLEKLNQVVPLSEMSDEASNLALKLFPGSCILLHNHVYVAGRRISDPPGLKIQIKATKGLESLPNAMAQTLISELKGQ